MRIMQRFRKRFGVKTGGHVREQFTGVEIKVDLSETRWEVHIKVSFSVWSFILSMPLTVSICKIRAR